MRYDGGMTHSSSVTAVTVYSGVEGSALITVSRETERTDYPDVNELPQDMRDALTAWLANA